MRFATTIATVLALATLTGCATTTADVSRRGDTAVRAEARRISRASVRQDQDTFRDGPGAGPRTSQSF